MENNQEIPSFDNRFSELNLFIHKLVELYRAGNINTWDDLERQVMDFFDPLRMEQMDSLVLGWQRMSSYSDGVTLVHVMCVFLGMYMMPEFQSLGSIQQNLMKWIILFHDIDKFHIRGIKDTMHAFRSGVVTAKRLPALGFSCTEKYSDLIEPWSEYTAQAFISNDANTAPTPDNRKLPQILSGIEQLYGENPPATLIIKTVLLHISLHVDDFYPTPAALTKEEAKLYIDSDLLPLLRVMMMSDNEGWSLFEQETRTRQRRDTLAVFEELEKFIF
jgi:hypothetical protein